MYIKSLTLRGFLCYKDATTVTFDPKFNVIIGKNGSGKSSLLTGIRFLMGEATAVDKEQYLHRGASSRVLVGYVSAVIDNSDGRLTLLNSPELILRRDFGQKRDELTLNNKKITKQELQSLLESAGFSRTNPYYFVHQHEVANLTGMQPPERLQLLRDVAGTRVYDERRAEAAKSLEETRNRRIAINKTLDVIIDRMKELKEEQQELKEFMDLEKERRCIEALLTSKELEEVSEQIYTMEETKNQNIVKLTGFTTKLKIINETIEQLDMEHQNDEGEVKRLTKQQKDLRKKVTEVEGQITQLELSVESRKGESAKRKKEKATKIAELNRLETDSRNIEADVRRLGPGKIAAENVAREEEMGLRRSRQELSQLQNKANRKEQFGSVTERNKKLSEMIKKKEAEIKEFTKQKNEAAQQLHELETLISNNSKASIELKAEIDRTDAEVSAISGQICQTSREVYDLAERLTILRQQDQKLQENSRQKNNDLYQATKRLNSTMRHEQYTANEAARRWAVETNKQNLVFGTLIDNIRVHPDYHVAVETAGGAQLFNFLVANRQIAIEIIGYIKARKEGSATLTPLQDIENRHENLPNLPVDNDTRIKRLLDVIECDAHIAPAAKQVFGRFLLVQDKEVGRQYYRSGFDCITLEGDTLSKKGVLKGGFLGHQKRMASQAQINEARNRLEQIQREGEATERELKEGELKIQEMQRSQRDRETERERLKLRRLDLNGRLQKLEKDKVKHEHRRTIFESQLSESNGQIDLGKEEIQRMRREVSLPTLGDLTEEESKRLSELSRTLGSMESEYEKKQKVYEDLLQQLSGKEFQLNEVLKPMIERLREDLGQLNDDEQNDGGNGEEEDEEGFHRERAQLATQLRTLKADLDQTETHRSTLQSSVARSKQALGQSKAKQEKLKRKIEIQENELQSLQAQLETQLIIRDGLNGRQQPMAGTSELLNELSQLSSHELTKQLAAVAKKLRTFDDVNRKASDQYSSFIDEQTQLSTQRERLYKEEDSVLELMKSLDDQKDGTLLQTFQNVNMRFGEVFAEIVPGGKAKLVLKRLSSDDVRRLRRQAETAAEGQPKIDDLEGVVVKVQFPSCKDYIPLELLSGGQRSVTALALMFALQRVDSAPFYVLDEVDASLDTQYRGSLAKLIQRQSQLNQIIVISHKPEAISLANQFLHTSIINQTTLITPTTLQDALRISQRIEVEESKNAQAGRKRMLTAGLAVNGEAS